MRGSQPKVYRPPAPARHRCDFMTWGAKRNGQRCSAVATRRHEGPNRRLCAEHSAELESSGKVTAAVEVVEEGWTVL